MSDIEIDELGIEAKVEVTIEIEGDQMYPIRRLREVARGVGEVKYLQFDMLENRKFRAVWTRMIKNYHQTQELVSQYSHPSNYIADVFGAEVVNDFDDAATLTVRITPEGYTWLLLKFGSQDGRVTSNV